MAESKSSSLFNTGSKSNAGSTLSKSNPGSTVIGSKSNTSNTCPDESSEDNHIEIMPLNYDPTPSYLKRYGLVGRAVEAIVDSKVDINYRTNKVVRKWLKSVYAEVDEKDSGKDITITVSREIRLSQVPAFPIGFGFYLMAKCFYCKGVPALSKIFETIMSVPDWEFQDHMLSFLHDYKIQYENIGKVGQKRRAILAGLLAWMMKACSLHGILDHDRPLDLITYFMGSLKMVYMNTYYTNMKRLLTLRNEMDSVKFKMTLSCRETSTLSDFIRKSDEEEELPEDKESTSSMDPVTRELIETTELIDCLQKAKNSTNYVTVEFLETKVDCLSKSYVFKKCQVETAKSQLAKKEKAVESMKEEYTELRNQLYNLQKRLSDLQMEEIRRTSFSVLGKPRLSLKEKLEMPGNDSQTDKYIEMGLTSMELSFGSEVSLQATEKDTEKDTETLSEWEDTTEISKPEVPEVHADASKTSHSDSNLAKDHPSSNHSQLAASRTKQGSLLNNVPSVVIDLPETSTSGSTVQTDAAQTYAAQTDTAQTDAARTDAAQTYIYATLSDAATRDPARRDSAQTDAAKTDATPKNKDSAEDNEELRVDLMNEYIDNSVEHARFLVDSLFQVRNTAKIEWDKMRVKHMKVYIIAAGMKKILDEVGEMQAKLPELKWRKDKMWVFNRLPVEHKCVLCLCHQVPMTVELDREEEEVKLNRSLMHCKRYQELLTSLQASISIVQQKLIDTLTVTRRAMDGLMWGKAAGVEKCPGIFVPILDSDKAVTEEVELMGLKPKIKNKLLEHCRNTAKSLFRLTRLLVTTLKNSQLRLLDIRRQHKFVDSLEERVRQIENQLIRTLLTMARSKCGPNVLVCCKLLAGCRCPQCNCLVPPQSLMGDLLSHPMPKDIAKVQSWEERMLARTSLVLRQATPNVVSSRKVHGTKVIISGIRPEAVMLTEECNKMVQNMMTVRKSKTDLNTPGSHTSRLSVGRKSFIRKRSSVIQVSVSKEKRLSRPNIKYHK